jgi:hypothetical protein
MQDEVETWFEDLCTIERSTVTDDAYGGRDESAPATIATGVPCLLEPGVSVGHRSLEQLTGVLRDQMIYTVTLPAGTNCQVDDILTITSQNNLKLRVQVSMAPESMNIDDQVIANSLT